MTERALYEIAPRYEKSGLIRAIYDAFCAVWDREIPPREAEILSCDAVDTMPAWLLERYCTYFGVDSSYSESRKRQELNWRILTLNEMTDLRTMLDALGLDCTLRREEDTLHVYLMLQAGQPYEDMDVIAAQIAETLQNFGPAHLLYDVQAATAVGTEGTIYYGTTLTQGTHFYVDVTGGD